MSKCKICQKEIDGCFGSRCSRCDKIAADLMTDISIELGDAA